MTHAGSDHAAEAPMKLPELLDKGYIRTLAGLYPNSGAADYLFACAGIDAGGLPAWGGLTPPLQYWTAVCKDLALGKVPGGLAALLRTAAAQWEGNETLRRFRVDALAVVLAEANPFDSGHLGLDHEWNRVTAAVARPGGARTINLHGIRAARLETFRQAVADHQPGLVHLAMHGQDGGMLLFDDGRGATALVPADAVASVLRKGGRVRCAVFNGCDTKDAAWAVAGVVGVAIGYDGLLADDAALAFSEGFYTALAEGACVGPAVERGRAGMAPAWTKPGAPPMEFAPHRVVVAAAPGVDVNTLDLFRPA